MGTPSTHSKTGETQASPSSSSAFNFRPYCWFQYLTVLLTNICRAFRTSRDFRPSMMFWCCFTAAVRSLAEFGVLSHRPTIENTNSRKVIVSSISPRYGFPASSQIVPMEEHIAIVELLHTAFVILAGHGLDQFRQFFFCLRRQARRPHGQSRSPQAVCELRGSADNPRDSAV